MALEAKRKERRKAQARKAAAKRGFKRPRDYYAIGTAADVRANLTVVPNSAVRVRQTKGPGPIGLVQNGTDSVVTFRKGPWLDKFDFAAQVYVADARWSREVIPSIVGKAVPTSRLRRLGDLRDAIKERMGPKNGSSPHPLAGWRPLGISTLETSLADHLRKNAAVKLLTESSEIMERTG